MAGRRSFFGRISSRLASFNVSQFLRALKLAVTCRKTAVKERYLSNKELEIQLGLLEQRFYIQKLKLDGRSFELINGIELTCL